MTSKQVWAFEQDQISYNNNYFKFTYVRVNLPIKSVNMLHFNKKF